MESFDTSSICDSLPLSPLSHEKDEGRKTQDSDDHASALSSVTETGSIKATTFTLKPLAGAPKSEASSLTEALIQPDGGDNQEHIASVALKTDRRQDRDEECSDSRAGAEMVRLISKRRFTQHHFDHIRKGGFP